VLITAQDQGANFPINVSFSFSGQIIQVILVNITHQQKIYDAGVFAFGVVVEEVGALEVAEPGDDAVDHLINPQDFADHRFEFRKQWMVFVGLIENLPAAFMGCEEFDSGELVEFFPDRIRRHIKFFGQFPQV